MFSLPPKSMEKRISAFLLLNKIFQQIFLRFRAPKSFVGLNNIRQRPIAVVLPLLSCLPQLIQRGERHGQMGVDQFLSPRDLRQVQGGVCCGIQTAASP